MGSDSGPSDRKIVIIGFCFQDNLAFIISVFFQLGIPAENTEELILAFFVWDKGSNASDQFIYTSQSLHFSGVTGFSLRAQPSVICQVHVENALAFWNVLQNAAQLIGITSLCCFCICYITSVFDKDLSAVPGSISCFQRKCVNSVVYFNFFFRLTVHEFHRTMTTWSVKAQHILIALLPFVRKIRMTRDHLRQSICIYHCMVLRVTNLDKLS